jgi:membrane-associated phospholipid phosphatase
MWRSLALVLSRIFDPILVIPGILVMVVGLAMINGYEWWFLAVLLALDGGIPGAYVMWRYMANGGTDWDIRDRRERRGVYALTIAAHFIGLAFVYYFGSALLFMILLVLWLVAISFAAITWYWKISVHAGVNSTLAVLVTYFFGWATAWIWLIPLGVSWSRVYLGHHTLTQVLVGLVVPVIILGGWVVSFNFF